MAATILAAPSACVAERKLPISPSRWIFRTLHLWVGLSFRLLLVAQGLSGAALVWRPELDRWSTIARLRTRWHGRLCRTVKCE